jgi:hypothetical protein
VDGDFSPISVGDDPAELIDVDVLGTGLIAIRREVFTDLARVRHGDCMPWFADTIRDRLLVEEDYEFCLRAKEAGHRVALAARVYVPHVKMVAV